jgi:UDP-2-acetamido-2,6-beta-L-arabino-hexul-4-ose reductase
LDNSYHEITVHGGTAKVVDTIPGWVHDITNIGPEIMIVLTWANEKFDRANPDTYPGEVVS